MMRVLLQFQGVSQWFPGSRGEPPRRILDGVDFTLERGEVTALVGRSGAGKTTLLYLAAGLARPSGGRIVLDGRELGSLSGGELSRFRRRRIGLVFQNNLCLSALPAWENAALPLLLEGWPLARARRRSEEFLERVGLAGFAEASTGTLSGGQRRRLGIARAMLSEPELLLADEPTADLDGATSSEIERLVFDWLQEGNRAGLIVTHEAAIERFARRVVCLADGRLQEISPQGRPA